jgi:hypothetical protein
MRNAKSSIVVDALVKASKEHAQNGRGVSRAAERASPDFSHADKVKGWGWRRPVNARDQLEDEAY